MKKSLIFSAMLLAVACSAADKVIDLSKPTAWNNQKRVTVPQDGTISAAGSKGFIYQANELIPVDDKHTYNFSGTVFVPTGKIGGGSYVGYFMYDAKKKIINQINAVSEPGSTTELTEAIKKGATTLKIKANKKWKAYGHFYIGFNVKDGELSYDNSVSGIKAIKQDGNVMTITLFRPIYKDYPAGTKVRIQKSGSYFYSNIIRPTANKAVNFQNELNKSKFWAKTAYIRPMILVNWGLSAKTDSAKVETQYKNMKLTIKEIK
ncbi:MAG: hypothetical protein IKB16_05000 [Lentisphaeria bacterium]|nr:hypothetical protein [Lentisphaeria bacterium]